jgi:peptidoglycan/xylan/chitin deacetylase (PgdA/CDA1 family)
LLGRVLPAGVLIARASPRACSVALTFDDGPHPEHTPRILDTLRDYGAKATFFAIGREAEKHPELVRRIVVEGHTLGCHTHTHADLSRLTLRLAWQECRQGRLVLEGIAGCRVRYLRPPWGRMSVSTLPVSLANHMTVALWSLDSLDHRGWPAAQLIQHLQDTPATSGDILLFHDDGANTAEALPEILTCFRTRTLSCVTLEALLATRHLAPVEVRAQ